MAEKYKNKYRIPSARLRYWDYGANAAYFITICTKNKQIFFGSVSDNAMQLSKIGKIAEQCWQEIPDHFPFVELDAFVVMPNHVHGIIIINKPGDRLNVETQNLASGKRDVGNNVETQNLASGKRDVGNNAETQNLASGKRDVGNNAETQNLASDKRDVGNNLETQNLASLQQQPRNKFGPQSQNLASIVRGNKTGVTKNARLINADFSWQERYYDHIIRNKKSWLKIAEYIRNNPLNWREDRYQPE
jgi:REP element-mobilizing transposase RayT